MRVIWALWAVLAVGLVAIAADAEDQNICRRGGGDDVQVVLQWTPDHSEVRLNVDQAYFDHRPRTDEVMRRESMLVFLNADDFSPWPRDIERSVANGPLVRYLVTYRLPLEIIAGRTATFNYGYRLSDAVTISEIPGPFGLLELTAPQPNPARHGALVGKHEVYVARGAQDEITDVIYCDAPGKVARPLCKHIIGDRPMALDMDYSADLLPGWAEVSTRARAFFDCVTEPGVE